LKASGNKLTAVRQADGGTTGRSEEEVRGCGVVRRSIFGTEEEEGPEIGTMASKSWTGLVSLSLGSGLVSLGSWEQGLTWVWRCHPSTRRP